MCENLKPSWEELKLFGLVYSSPTKKKEVVSKQTVLRLLHILKSEYNQPYIFSCDDKGQEISENEYNQIYFDGPVFFSLITYEEQVQEKELRKRILRKLKNGNN